MTNDYKDFSLRHMHILSKLFSKLPIYQSFLVHGRCESPASVIVVMNYWSRSSTETKFQWMSQNYYYQSVVIYQWSIIEIISKTKYFLLKTNCINQNINISCSYFYVEIDSTSYEIVHICIKRHSSYLFILRPQQTTQRLYSFQILNLIQNLNYLII